MTSLIGIELKKIKRSKIVFIILAAAIILWIPSILNAKMNAEMQAEGILPEHNLLIQGLLAMSWFMYPACMIVITVLLAATEKKNNGILKMLALPVNTFQLCLAKFAVVVFLSAVQILITVGVYYVSAFIITKTQNYNYILPPAFVIKEAEFMFFSSIPMLSFFWLLAVCIKKTVFSVGIGLVSIVPSIVMINTKFWFAYPMGYPLFFITAEYGNLAKNIDTQTVELVPWLLVALAFTFICLLLSCIFFGKTEKQ